MGPTSAHLGHKLSNPVHQGIVGGPVMAPPHGGQDAGAAALGRHVQLLGHVWPGCYNLPLAQPRQPGWPCDGPGVLGLRKPASEALCSVTFTFACTEVGGRRQMEVGAPSAEQERPMACVMCCELLAELPVGSGQQVTMPCPEQVLKSGRAEQSLAAQEVDGAESSGWA